MAEPSSPFNVTVLFKVASSGVLGHRELNVPEGCLVLTPRSGGFIPWDNPDNIISQEVETAVDEIVAVVCLPILFMISVPCNVLNMWVFWRQGLKERINLCLFCLSLVDFLHMLNNFFFNVDRLYNRLPFSHHGSGRQQFGPVLKFIMDHYLVGFRGFNWLSGFVSMLIACERCLCVASPLRSHAVLKTGTMAGILVLGSLIIMTGSMLVGLRWSLACVLDPETNTTSTAIYTSQFYIQNRAHLNVLSVFIGTVQPFTYVTVVLATTIVTSVKLKKMAAWRQKMSSSALSSREMALTRTLIAVSILYIVCSVPLMVLGISVFVPGMNLSGRYYNLTNLLVSIFELTSFINATFNFFVYCFLGSKYKETLRSLFQCTPSVSSVPVAD